MSDNTNQSLPGFFKRPTVGMHLNSAYLMYNTVRMANVLENISGINGIVFRKSRGADGLGWVVDGADASSGTPDEKSISQLVVEGMKILQWYGFDAEGGTEYGITDIMSADPETGKLSAENGENYEIAVRVGGPGGKVGYMPFGAGTGKPDEPTDPCDDHPGGGDGVEIDADQDGWYPGNGATGVPLGGDDNDGVTPCEGESCTI